MAEERIIVVDDEDLIREVVCSVLSQAGYDCVPVDSANEALAMLNSDESASMVLSDLIMDGMDGLTLLSRIRKDTPTFPS